MDVPQQQGIAFDGERFTAIRPHGRNGKTHNTDDEDADPGYIGQGILAVQGHGTNHRKDQAQPMNERAHSGNTMKIGIRQKQSRRGGCGHYLRRPSRSERHGWRQDRRILGR